MITHPTVLILGAGASVEFQYPDGKGLKNDVLEITGKPEIDEYQCLLDLGFPKDFIKSFRIALYFSGRQSIDLFLEHRPKFIEIGKASIALALIRRENVGTLFKDSDNWYAYLFRQMEAPFEEFSNNQIGIITFNYDRSFETFLYNALKNSYGKNEIEVANILSAIPIAHVHGKLGDLPWQSSEGRPYRPNYDPKLIQYSANGIRIIYEEDQVSSAFGLAHKIIKASQRVIFLGFGYNITNLERLNLDLSRQSKYQFLGTCYGFTKREAGEIEIYFQKRINLQDNISYKILEFLKEKVTLKR